ncbi:glycosyltransferase family 2 protein [[Muricauda] lutisoli]|uniref:Glycosyltransferase family 2 protein n=1 Tax=[Muricauda] lutisoli TaxID=2816035 RepID=A0ABS3EXT3_9FLAO|nr:glycosyltransferase family 2 protein [[Muricauda] lutisoli]MBO0330932.1 glycosyltransferase family 2 protein [[Muricauda] lutisoli]
MINQKELSIIIVNYNGAKYLQGCLDSVKNTCNGIDYEIIIVDNNSSDNSLDILKRKYAEEVCLIESKENLGFAGGNNLGVSKSNGKYILLLNNDTILLDKLEPLIKLIGDDEIGAIGIKMLGKQREYRKSVGRFPSAFNLIKLSRLYYSSKSFKLGNFHKDSYTVDWIEGSFLLTRRQLWDKVGGLDDTFFMYGEDLDYCKKVSIQLKKCIYYTKCSYIHFGGYNAGRQKLLKKGFVKYLNKHAKGLGKVLARISLEINFAFKNVKKLITKVTI